MLDLASGVLVMYWQIRVKPKDQEKMAFITNYGIYEFMVMPFRLFNALATFESRIKGY